MCSSNLAPAMRIGGLSAAEAATVTDSFIVSVQIVAVANDITFSSGSFGTKEDAVFRAATEYALEEKLPLIYLAANAGARVGLAQEVKQCLQVKALNFLVLAVSGLPVPLQHCKSMRWRTSAAHLPGRQCRRACQAGPGGQAMLAGGYSCVCRSLLAGHV